MNEPAPAPAPLAGTPTLVTGAATGIGGPIAAAPAVAADVSSRGGYQAMVERLLAQQRSHLVTRA